MIRQGIRRHAGLAGRLASAAMPLGARARLPLARQAIALLSHPPRQLAPVLLAARPYSRPYTSAAAVNESRDPEAAAASDKSASSFDDLSRLGVHPNLLKAITQDLKYNEMTPVQAKTINPALKGTDM